MRVLNNPADVVVSRPALTDDGRLASAVRERCGAKRLLGHVAPSRVTPGGWTYRTAGEEFWTMVGFSRAEAVDRLQSAWHPQGKFLLPE